MSFQLEPLPKRPFATFAAFVQFQKDRLHKKGYPCLSCYGYGRIIDPSEQPDPVEGHKHSNRIDCSDCRGTGQMTPAQYKLIYQRSVNEWSEAYQKAKTLRGLQRSGLAKIMQHLSRQERKALEL